MRSIYDQYDQPENKLTHALGCTLVEDRHQLRPFLLWLGVSAVPPLRDLRVAQQQVPGEPEPRDEDEAAGLPDLCIYTEDGWCAAFESKIQAGLNAGQLRRHTKTLNRYGFEHPHLVTLSVDQPTEAVRQLAINQAWCEVYAWFRRRRDESDWAVRLTDYMEAFEARMLPKGYGIRGTLTMFDGMHFDRDHPYTYLEGKRLIRLLGDRLRAREDLHRRLGIMPNGKGRGAITGRTGDRVWDFIPLKSSRDASSFTAHPHLTLDIGEGCASASVTIPNGIKGGLRTKLRREGSDGFGAVLAQIERNLRPVVAKSKGSAPFIYVVQRHFLSQRSGGIEDASMAADLRTLIPTASRVKHQPQWGQAVYDLLANKRSNLQLGVQLRMKYTCPIVRSQKAEDLFAEAWIAMRPLLDFVQR